jgi:hypothetical protein
MRRMGEKAAAGVAATRAVRESMSRLPKRTPPPVASLTGRRKRIRPSGLRAFAVFIAQGSINGFPRADRANGKCP